MPAESYTAPIDGKMSPKIFDRQSRMVPIDLDGTTYYAILVTEDMINDLDRILAERSKLEYLEGRLEKADRSVDFGDIHVRYCKSLLENAQNQEEADEFRQDLEQRQTALEISRSRWSRLENRVGEAKNKISYIQALSQGNIQTMLADAGLLEPEHEYVDDEDKEDEKRQISAKGQSEGGDSEPYPYEFEHAASEVSIEELHRKTVSEEVLEKYRELIEQEQAFESRHQEYAA